MMHMKNNPKKKPYSYQTIHKIRGAKRKVEVSVGPQGKRKRKILEPKKRSKPISLKKAREAYKAHRLKLDKDLHSRSKKVLKHPTEAWAKNPSKYDVKGIDEPSALKKIARKKKRKEAAKQQRKQARKARGKKPKFAEFTTSRHPYKAGKSWVSTATKNWGVSGNFMKHYDVSKDGYYTTKHYKLPDGRYIAETVGSKAHPHRETFIVKDGKIEKV
jgi:hypothetical protein